MSEDVAMSFFVAGVALCDIPRVWGGMCEHDRREAKVAVTMGIVAKTWLFWLVSKAVVMSFFVASVALRDIPLVWGGMCEHDRREAKVAVTMGLVAKTWLFWLVSKAVVMSFFRGKRGTSWHSTCVRRNLCARSSTGTCCASFVVRSSAGKSFVQAL